MGAHAIAPEPAGARQLEMPGERAVGGEQQQAFGVEVEPPDRDHARQLRRQRLEHGLAPLRILVAGDEALRLVVAPEPRQSRLGERLAVHRDDVPRRHDDGRRGQHLAVDGDAALTDPRLGVAARAEPRMGDGLGDPHRLGGFRHGRRGGASPLTLPFLYAHFVSHDEAEACRCDESKQAAHGSRFRRGRGRRRARRGADRRRAGERRRRGAGARRQPHARASGIRPPMPSCWR